ncbi:MAG: sodium/glutamate symporter [Lachnospiraceae bacterium]|jgi:ESS family glutamate:Na+ symporter
MENFWDYDVWAKLLVIGSLLLALLVANILKRSFKFLRMSLIPTSVLAGIIIAIVASIYKTITGDIMYDTAIFGGNGTITLEYITYHTLALGFIASTFRKAKGKISKKRAVEIFNTGVTTVSTYLIQAILGLTISLIAALFISGFFKAAGLLLPFGYGQGTGQALNYGAIYEFQFGFEGGKSFGLTIAALGFISAAVGGVIHLNILKKRGRVIVKSEEERGLRSEEVQSANEIPMQESIDKLTVQVALIALAYALAYGFMYLLGMLLPSMKSVVYGFNFLIGVLMATLVKAALNFLSKKNIVKKEHTNDFLMTRTSNLFFDIMVVAGIAAIRLSTLENYWGVILIMGVLGLIITYYYNRIVAKTLFKEYQEEQFLVMYGMLTGTASTGIILLREIDGDFKTPAADNLVYQNFPAIVFGFPMMLLATFAPVKPVLTLIILIVFFIVMNIILFRAQIFRRKKKTAKNE